MREMLFGEPQQQLVKALSLGRIERRQEVVLESLGEGTEAIQRLPSVGRNVDQLPSAVRLIAATLDQSALFQLVQQPDELPAVVTERICDRALRLVWVLLERDEDRVMGRAETGALVFAHRLLLRGAGEPLPAEGGRG